MPASVTGCELSLHASFSLCPNLPFLRTPVMLDWGPPAGDSLQTRSHLEILGVRAPGTDLGGIAQLTTPSVHL